MKKTGWIILGIIVVLVLWVFSGYNGMVGEQEKATTELSNMQAQYQRRADMMPQLAKIVKAYAKHEKELLERITQARSAAMNATSINGKIEADNALTSALAGLKVQVEAYPELKANQNFLQLQSEISDVENKLAATRRFFNSATKELNNGVQTFPAVLFAGMFGFHREPMFEVPASERANYDKAPEVKF